MKQYLIRFGSILWIFALPSAVEDSSSIYLRSLMVVGKSVKTPWLQ